MFNDVSRARRKIGEVINGFQDMIDDLNAGINLLADVIRKNTEKIDTLANENYQCENEIVSATSIKNKISKLID